jgi:hypothetical protein
LLTTGFPPFLRPVVVGRERVVRGCCCGAVGGGGGARSGPAAGRVARRSAAQRARVVARARGHPVIDHKENGDGRALAAGRGAESRRVVARAHRSWSNKGPVYVGGRGLHRKSHTELIRINSHVENINHFIINTR